MSKYICVDGIETLIELVDAPVIEIVRCKDCKMFKPYDGRSDGYCEVPRMTYDGDEYINVEDDNYCNYGVRKEHRP